MALTKPKSEMILAEAQAREQEGLNTGPFSVLSASVRDNKQVLIMCVNNRNLLAHIKSFDEDCNMILENVKEIWTDGAQPGKGKKKKAKSVDKHRFMSRVFLSGDSVVLVVRNPPPNSKY